MTANINPQTGIAYGYISSHVLDIDVVNELLFGSGARNITQDDAFAEWMNEKVAELMEGDANLSEEEAREKADGDAQEEFFDCYEVDEEIHEGVYEGVTYLSSWLGGALNFFISESPYTTDKARLASPCVPNAGILDVLDGSVFSYDVPPSWRNVDEG